MTTCKDHWFDFSIRHISFPFLVFLVSIHLNPHNRPADSLQQITLGLCISYRLPWIRGALFIAAQLLASLCAGGIVSAMFPVPISEANTVLGGGASVVQGLFMEMFFTALLVFVVLMLAIEKSKDTFLAPIGIGLALFVAEIAGELPFDGWCGMRVRMRLGADDYL